MPPFRPPPSPVPFNPSRNQQTDAEAKATKRAAAKAYAQSLTAQIERNASIEQDENKPNASMYEGQSEAE